jgi:uncharacterized membrane protein YbaN (DUF454 family)
MALMSAAPPPPSLHGPRRWLNVGLGLAFVGLAALGVVLPVLPTTPFLIVASACFVRSSPRLNAWLLRSRVFGGLLREWQEHRRVRRRVKYTAAAVLLAALAASAGLGQLSWLWLTALIVLGLIGLSVVLRLPEMPRGAGTMVEQSAQADPPAPGSCAPDPDAPYPRTPAAGALDLKAGPQ